MQWPVGCRARRALGCVAGLLALSLLASACARDSNHPRRGALQGDRLEVLGPWSDAEAHRFGAVLLRFEVETGVDVTYKSAGSLGVPDLLNERLAAGSPPDIALVPQPGLLRDLAGQGRLVPLRGSMAHVLRRNYSTQWRRLGSYEGRTYGVWFKAANKSLVWYSIAAFEQAGVVPPDTLDELRRVAASLTASGVPAWAVPGASGWTLTDWFENLLLCRSGPKFYDDLAAHRVPWTQPHAIAALREMTAILAPAQVAGGVAAAARTDFEKAVEQVFAQPSKAAMVMEADFVGGAIAAHTSAEIGIDADAFAFPCGRSTTPRVVAGGDAAVALRPSPAAQRLLHYLATPAAARLWAARGGFISPNLELDLAVYPDDLSRLMARGLLDAGEDLRFDLSDLQPPQFGGSEQTGMQPLLRGLLRHRDVDRTAALLEEAADRAYAGSPRNLHREGR